MLENKQANAKIVELDEDEQPLVDVPMAKYWVILIYANWSVASRNFEAVLAGLSLRYDGPNVKFGELETIFTTIPARIIRLVTHIVL